MDELNFLDKMPELLKVEHLIQIGMYHDPRDAWRARQSNECPSFIRIGKKILYPKLGVMKFLDKKMKRY